MNARHALPLVGAAAAVAAIAAAGRRAGGAACCSAATAEERTGPLPGDSYAPGPRDRSTMAITIEAGPEQIWPWLAQLGRGRGGLYSYDWLDRLFRVLDAPSATRVLPEFQAIAAGDVVPIGRSGGFPVLEVEPGRYLVLGGGDPEWIVAWALVLTPVGGSRTRLVSRYQANYPPTVRNRIVGAVLKPAAFVMTARMLRNLKGRAEMLARAGAA